MTRHTTFRYCLDPTAEQQVVLARHAGAARFAFNQCLRLHLQARASQRRSSSLVVPWSGFDFINLFNAWKKTEQAGRVIRVSADGTAEVEVTGLAWRTEVCQQVFEEAAADLNVTGMLRNHRLARAISDAAWTELARQLSYKQAWRHGQLVVADRWFPSSKTCSLCGAVRHGLGLADRTFDCEHCGHSIDRDLNAAINLATWAEQHHGADARVRDPQAGGPVTKAHRQGGPGPHSLAGETGLDDVGTDGRGAPAARTDDAREGRWRRSLTEAVPARFKVLGDDHIILA